MLLTPSIFNWNRLATQSAYEITGNSGVTIIRGKKFTNTNQAFQWGNCVYINGGSGTIIFEGCYFGPSEGLGLEAENFTGTLIIRNCLFANNRGGVYLTNSSGITIIEYNQFVNPHNLDRAADKRSNRGQAVQLNACSGTIRIRYNVGESFRGEGYTEDWISLYQTNGSSGNPALVEYNVFRGGGPSASGGGIMTGDSDTEGGSSWQTVRFNRILDGGNYLFACAGGSNIVITNNKGYQPLRPWSNVGGYAYNGTASCDTINFSDNNIVCNSASNPPTNHYYLPTNDGAQCTNRTYNNNVSTIDEAGLGLAARLITFVSEDQLLKIREQSVDYQIDHVSGAENEFPAALHRPVTVTESNKNVFTNSTTINSTGSSSTNGYNYQWVQISGPNQATLSNANTATLTASGLIDGKYEFRLTITDNDGASASHWTTITVTLT